MQYNRQQREIPPDQTGSDFQNESGANQSRILFMSKESTPQQKMSARDNGNPIAFEKLPGVQTAKMPQKDFKRKLRAPTGEMPGIYPDSRERLASDTMSGPESNAMRNYANQSLISRGMPTSLPHHEAEKRTTNYNSSFKSRTHFIDKTALDSDEPLSSDAPRGDYQRVSGSLRSLGKLKTGKRPGSFMEQQFFSDVNVPQIPPPVRKSYLGEAEQRKIDWVLASSDFDDATKKKIIRKIKQESGVSPFPGSNIKQQINSEQKPERDARRYQSVLEKLREHQLLKQKNLPTTNFFKEKRDSLPISEKKQVKQLQNPRGSAASQYNRPIYDAHYNTGMLMPEVEDLRGAGQRPNQTEALNYDSFYDREANYYSTGENTDNILSKNARKDLVAKLNDRLNSPSALAQQSNKKARKSPKPVLQEKQEKSVGRLPTIDDHHRRKFKMQNKDGSLTEFDASQMSNLLSGGKRGKNRKSPKRESQVLASSPREARNLQRREKYDPKNFQKGYKQTGSTLLPGGSPRRMTYDSQGEGSVKRLDSNGGRYYYDNGQWKLSPVRDPNVVILNPKWYEWDIHGRHYPRGTLKPIPLEERDNQTQTNFSPKQSVKASDMNLFSQHSRQTLSRGQTPVSVGISGGQSVGRGNSRFGVQRQSAGTCISDGFKNKHLRQMETNTRAVRIHEGPKPVQVCMQIQTDIEPIEPKTSGVPTPINIVQPHLFSPTTDLTPMAQQAPIALQLQIETSEDEFDDWAESNLYKFILETHSEVVRQKVERLTKGAWFDKDRVMSPESARPRGPTLTELDIENLNPNNAEVWSATECMHYIQILKSSAAEEQFQEGSQMLFQIAEKAKASIDMLVQNMIHPIIMNKIFYRNYKEINVENSIKLLYRAKKLYEARLYMINVLKRIVEIEVTMEQSGPIWRILQQGQKLQGQGLDEPFPEVVTKMMRLISRTLSVVDGFKEENKMFAKIFLFKGKDHVVTLLKLASVFNGFLKIIGLPCMPMEETGIVMKSSTNPLNNLSNEQEDKEQQIEVENNENYNDWFQESIEVTGLLRLPVINPNMVNDIKKPSKIDAVLAAAPPKTANKETDNNDDAKTETDEYGVRHSPRGFIYRTISDVDQAESVVETEQTEEDEHASKPTWLVGEFQDITGNIIPFPQKQRDKKMRTTKDKDAAAAQLQDEIDEDDDPSVPFSFGYQMPKMLCDEITYLDKESGIVNRVKVPVKGKLVVPGEEEQPDYKIVPMHYDQTGEEADLTEKNEQAFSQPVQPMVKKLTFDKEAKKGSKKIGRENTDSSLEPGNRTDVSQGKTNSISSNAKKSQVKAAVGNRKASESSQKVSQLNSKGIGSRKESQPSQLGSKANSKAVGNRKESQVSQMSQISHGTVSSKLSNAKVGNNLGAAGKLNNKINAGNVSTVSSNKPGVDSSRQSPRNQTANNAQNKRKGSVVPPLATVNVSQPPSTSKGVVNESTISSKRPGIDVPQRSEFTIPAGADSDRILEMESQIQITAEASRS